MFKRHLLLSPLTLRIIQFELFHVDKKVGLTAGKKLRINNSRVVALTLTEK